jgi:hypothetical protein
VAYLRGSDLSDSLNSGFPQAADHSPRLLAWAAKREILSSAQKSSISAWMICGGEMLSKER